MILLLHSVKTILQLRYDSSKPYRLLIEDIGDSAAARLNIRIVCRRLLRLLRVRSVERNGMIFVFARIRIFNRVWVDPRLPLFLRRIARRCVEHSSTYRLFCYRQASYQDELRPHPVLKKRKLNPKSFSTIYF